MAGRKEAEKRKQKETENMEKGEKQVSEKEREDRGGGCGKNIDGGRKFRTDGQRQAEQDAVETTMNERNILRLRLTGLLKLLQW